MAVILILLWIGLAIDSFAKHRRLRAERETIEKWFERVDP